MPHAARILVSVGFVLLAAAHAAAEPATVESKLSLRAGPGPAFSAIAVIAPGSKLETEKCTDDWCRVKFGRLVGYASRSLLKIGTDSYASAAPQAVPAEPKPTPGGARVWQWEDGDWRNDHWRRLEWQNRLSGH
jgi:hypothetical protein